MQVMLCTNFLHSPLSTLSCSSSSSRPQLSVTCSLMDAHNQGSNKFREFPFVSTPQRNLMVGLVSTLENRLHSQLLPCTLPPDVQHYQNQSGAAQATLHIRSGQADSPVIFPSAPAPKILNFNTNYSNSIFFFGGGFPF